MLRRGRAVDGRAPYLGRGGHRRMVPATVFAVPRSINQPSSACVTDPSGAKAGSQSSRLLTYLGRRRIIGQVGCLVDLGGGLVLDFAVSN